MSFMYSVIFPADRDSLASCFPNCIHLISLSCCIAPASASNTIWKRNGDRDSGQLCLIPHLSRFQFSSIKENIKLSHTGFVMLRCVPFSPPSQTLTGKYGGFCQRVFNASIEMIMSLLSASIEMSIFF